MPKTLVVLVGPTGIGKTRTAIRIARHFKTEIVSADSRQIYREMKIGTAVPGDNELAQVKHHFIRTHSVKDDYNASKFESETLNLLHLLFKTYDTVVLVGGSMLYIDAICKGIDSIPDADPEIRQNLKNQLKKEGIEHLRLQLKKLDPDYYAQVDLKNPNRIIHALEICLTTGKRYSSFRSNSRKKRQFSILKIGLNCDRSELHHRINKRVDQMIENGLEEEARELYPFEHLNALQTVGYREFFACFKEEISKEKAVELIKRNSRRYARKQLTWFRKDLEINWFNSGDTEEIIGYIEKQTGNEK